MPERLLYDFLEDFSGGINSDLPPSILPKNVAAWTTNATLRGGFARPRPPRFLRPLTFPSEAVQTAVETGLFQGATKKAYRPDFGPSQFVAQISGRLFTFTEIGSSWTVAEITIPGDPNDATTSQVWMNQLEKWLIITDGSAKLPIFWDGVTARRSLGPSTVLGTATAFAPAAPPDIGDMVQLTLNAPYTGAFGITVLFNGEYYRTSEGVSPTPSYGAVFAPGLLAVAPVNFDAGAPVSVDPSLLGYCYSTGQGGTTYYLRLVTGSNVPVVGSIVSVNGYSFIVNSKSTPGGFDGGLANVTSYQLTCTRHPSSPFPPSLASIIGYVYITSSDPVVVVGTLSADVTLNVLATSMSANISAEYSGAAGQTVVITDDTGTLRLFTIAAAAAPPPSGTLNLVNLTDTSAIAYVNPTDVISVPELPAGRMGAYGKGRQCMCLTDGKSYIYGDVVGGPSGSAAFDYRDAVLKMTEGTFLPGGGSFKIPTSGEIITSMTFTAILDAAYGQGPLEIGTPTTIFTCAVPADLSTLNTATSPILTEALIGKGPLAQNSTMLANSDTLFRFTDGLGSLIFGRRDFETWGNTPISTEVNRIVGQDNRALLSYGSALEYDNRKLDTALPFVSSNGVCHAATLALNFDPVSSLRGKAPSIWESVWDGLQVLQFATGTFNGSERCFMFVCNEATSTIELWEQLRSDSTEYLDSGTDRIAWTVECPCIFLPKERPQDMPLVRLVNGKIHLSDIRGELHVKVSYRPDFHEAWETWHEFDITDETDPGYLSPIGLGEPSPANCDAPNNRPLRSGRFFQPKFEFIGQCIFKGGEFAAVPEPSILFPSPICGNVIS